MIDRLARAEDRWLIVCNRRFLARRRAGFAVARFAAFLLRHGTDSVVVTDGDAVWASGESLRGRLQREYPSFTDGLMISGYYYRAMTSAELALRDDLEGVWENELRDRIHQSTSGG